MTKRDLWERYQAELCVCESIGLSLDTSRMDFPADYFERMAEPMSAAFAAMAELEAGAIANPDEGRQVGHYWLRAPDLAPEAALTAAITDALEAVRGFSAVIHERALRSERGLPFEKLLVVGIGGSALGPQFMADALTSSADRMQPYFFDNTDPDGFDRTLAEIGDGLAQTLTVVISKSGGTKETRNGMLEAKAAYEAAGLDFAKHAVAITGEGSALDRIALEAGWLRRFPMWDWVGGRTSVLSAVGLLPAALQGFDVEALLAGARETDVVTRSTDLAANPAARLALAWHFAGKGRGEKDMVILPYKDRLLLLSKYLQQLVMESLGKELDLEGRIVNQGIAVYGNKGSTDQHAYVQQLREGVHNFFATFVQVLRDRGTESLAVEPDVTSGDYLLGFQLGTRAALYEKGRQSITITLDELGPWSIGSLIALYERAVGLYGALVGINAYHQPGVEAGKKAATEILELQGRILAELRAQPELARSAEDIAAAIGADDEVESVFHVLRHLAANPDHGVRRSGRDPLRSVYRLS